MEVLSGTVGAMTVTNSSVNGSRSGRSGGAIFNSGDLTLDDIALIDNHRC